MRVVPFLSIGELSFGDTRDVAREKLKSSFATFQKVIGAEETDSFDLLGIHLYYDDDGKLEFVEAFRPADVEVGTVELLDRDVADVVRDLELLGYESSATDVGFQFDEIGVALTAPNGIVEGVAAYRKGYYDE